MTFIRKSVPSVINQLILYYVLLIPRVMRSWSPSLAYSQTRSRTTLTEEHYEEEADLMNPRGKSLFLHRHKHTTNTCTCREALEWVWCPEQVLQAFLRFGTLFKGTSAALQKCPGTPPAQSPIDGLLPGPKLDLLSSEPGIILGGLRSTHPKPWLLLCMEKVHVRADQLTSTRASVNKYWQPREEGSDADSLFRCSVVPLCSQTLEAEFLSTLAWLGQLDLDSNQGCLLKEHLYWPLTDPGSAP